MFLNSVRTLFVACKAGLRQTECMKKQWGAIAAVAVGPVALAAVGLTHPARLTAESAPWWTTMHVILVPIFPLLAVAVWVLLRNDRTAVGWGGRIAAVIYAAFYGGLDAVSGIATGTVTQAGADTSSEFVRDLFAAGRPLGLIGGYAFFVAVILVLASLWLRGTRGWLFYAAAVVALVSAYLFTTSHIYWPKGVATMLGFAISLTALELIRQRGVQAQAPAR